MKASVVVGVGVVLGSLAAGQRGYADCRVREPKPTVRILIRACEVAPTEIRRPRVVVDEPRETRVGSEAVQLGESYRGVLVTAEVRGRSQRYLYQTSDVTACKRFPRGQEFLATLEFACCDGDPNPPCLLGLSWLLKRAQRITAAGP